MASAGLYSLPGKFPDIVRRGHAEFLLETLPEILHAAYADHVRHFGYIVFAREQELLGPPHPYFSDKFVRGYIREGLYLPVERRMAHVHIFREEVDLDLVRVYVLLYQRRNPVNKLAVERTEGLLQDAPLVM